MKNKIFFSKENLNENGYCVVERIVSKEILENAQDSFCKIKKSVKRGDYPYYRIYDDCAFNKNISGIELVFHSKILTQPIIDFIVNSKVLEIAKQQLGDEIELDLCRYHLTESFSHVGNWHRDEDINHKNNSIQINVFLFDEKGLQIINNSHKKKNTLEEEIIKKTPHASLLVSKWISTRAGEILVFDPAVLHRGISQEPRANIHFRFKKKNRAFQNKIDLNYKNLDIPKEWIFVLENSPKAVDEKVLKPYSFRKDFKSIFYRFLRKVVHNFIFFLPLHSKIYYYFNIWPNLKLRKIFNIKT